jgi:hypothetical protein
MGTLFEACTDFIVFVALLCFTAALVRGAEAVVCAIRKMSSDQPVQPK